MPTWSGPRRGATFFLTPLFRVWNYFQLLPGGLRYAATIGYYLTAFQAEALHPIARDSDRCVLLAPYGTRSGRDARGPSEELDFLGNNYWFDNVT